MLGARDNDTIDLMYYPKDSDLLITIQSVPSQEADTDYRDVIFGVYRMVKLREKDDSFTFALTAPDKYNFGYAGAMNLLQLKQAYAVMYGSDKFTDGATLTIEEKALVENFEAPLTMYNPSHCQIGIDSVLGDKFAVTGLSLAIVIPIGISIDRWLMKFMVEHFKCTNVLT